MYNRFLRGFNMTETARISNYFRIFLIVCLINLFNSGCIKYSPRELSPNDLILIDNSRNIILHHGTNTYYLTQVNIAKQQLTGIVSLYPVHLYKGMGKPDPAFATHLHISDSFPLEIGKTIMIN